MNLTTEQIQAILDGAPDGAVYHDGDQYIDKDGCVWRVYDEKTNTGGYWADLNYGECGTPLELLQEILELREKLEIDVEHGFYDGYILGATNERDGLRNHLKLLPEVAEECANKYVNKYANKIKAGDL